MKKVRYDLANFVKPLLLVLIALALAVAALPLGFIGAARGTAAAAETDVAVAPRAEATIPDFELTINYFRGDGNYSKWNMWLWTLGGKAITDKNEFTADVQIGGKTWKTLTVTVSGAEADANGNVVGFIVRTDNWEKDPDGDRFVTVDAIVDNKVTLYLVTGDAGIYFTESAGEDAMIESMRKKISTAYFTSTTNVHIDASDAITAASYFKVKSDDGKIIGELNCKTSSDVVGGFGADIAVSNVDFTHSYTVVDEPAVVDDNVNFAKRQVVMSALYSSDEFNAKYSYDGVLGAEYSATETKFTVWSPVASAMKLNIYSSGEGTDQGTSYDMTAGDKGTWTYTLSGDQKNKYYTYSVKNGDTWTNDIVDPYARSGGRNGKRGMIVDLAATNPTGWDTQNMPTLASNSEAVIWEAQLRDVTIHESSGVSAANRGKFLGLTETGTKNASGKSTALDYLKDLGVTQVHFQPLFDFATVDESFAVATYNKEGEYNWGYDPLNYNMPEGSYSSDPSDGNKRVNEMKQLIMALHNAGIQVVMDVVYNHVSNAQASNFENLMPGYYFRVTDSGNYYNGSGCGNETASEHAMFRKFMIDSVVYWATEYKIDGFRFDLMGLHDIDTMNMLYDELAKVNPDVIVYGEGWTGGTSGLSSDRQAHLSNAKRMPNIAFFDDVIRDGLKGSFSSLADKGFVQGKAGSDNAVYVGAYGATENFAASPTQNINYVAAHDNSTLWDKLNASVTVDKNSIKAMNRLAATAVLTSQGIGFMLAGEEMMRSKPTTKTNSYDNRPNAYKTDKSYYFSDNSYKSPDSVNAINWNLLDDNGDMVEYYKGMIAIKKSFPQFHLTTKAQIDKCVTVNDENRRDGIASYAVKDPASNKYAFVILNNNDKGKTVDVPQGTYDIFVSGNKASAEKLSTFTGNSINIAARSAIVMVAELDASAVSGWKYSVEDVADEPDDNGLAIGLGIGIPVAVLAAGGIAAGVILGKKKKGKKADGNTSDDLNDKAEANSDSEEPNADDEQADGVTES